MDKLFSDYDKAQLKRIGVQLANRYGETMTLTDISNELGRGAGSLSKRLDQLGFTGLRVGDKKYKTWMATAIIYALLEGWGKGERDVRMHELRSAILRAERASGAARILGQR